MQSNSEKTERDPNKELINIHKHKKIDGTGLSFDEALEVFDDKFYIERFDDQHSKIDDLRYQVIGRVKSQLVVFVVYQAKKDDIKRIISARPALERERKFYYEQIRRYYQGM